MKYWLCSLTINESVTIWTTVIYEQGPSKSSDDVRSHICSKTHDCVPFRGFSLGTNHDSVLHYTHLHLFTGVYGTPRHFATIEIEHDYILQAYICVSFWLFYPMSSSDDNRRKFLPDPSVAHCS
jgi:hypothetical protein